MKNQIWAIERRKRGSTEKWRLWHWNGFGGYGKNGLTGWFNHAWERHPRSEFRIVKYVPEGK